MQPGTSGAAVGAVDVARSALRWKRVSLVFVTAVALGFIAISVAQIIPAVFGVGVRPLPAAAAGSTEGACAEGVRRLNRALDRAGPLAGGPAFAEALQPEWNDAPGTQLACGRSSEGLDAWAALLRLRSAEEQLAGRGDRDVATLRREVASHLPAELR